MLFFLCIESLLSPLYLNNRKKEGILANEEEIVNSIVGSHDYDACFVR